MLPLRPPFANMTERKGGAGAYKVIARAGIIGVCGGLLGSTELRSNEAPRRKERA